MLTTITMPKLSPTMTTGIIAKWHKALGDPIKQGDLLIEVATDKATIEYCASETGFLRQILFPEGKSASVGEPIAVISSSPEESLSDYVSPATQKEEVVLPLPATPQPHQKEINLFQYDRIAASPLAKKIAALEHLSLDGIVGSGPGGRIMSRDLEIVRLKKQPAPIHPTFAIPDDVTLTPLSPMRSAIAKNLQYAKSNIPHFYVSTTAEVSKLVAIREQLKAASIRLTVNDILTFATSRALMAHPAIRCSFFPDKNAIGLHANADIAIAVSVPGGIYTPIIHQAQNKTVFEISQEVKSFSEKAKAGKLLPNEYTGGAITITNLGMFGVDQFLPILNAPQVAILSVGAIADVPVLRNGSVIPGKTICLTVAADHRAVNGSDVADFLKTLKTLLEEMQEKQLYTQTS